MKRRAGRGHLEAGLPDRCERGSRIALTMCRLREDEKRVLPLPPAASPVALSSYGDWSDVYRKRWTWDQVVYASHTRANCISACSWNVFVKDGIVWREEQNAIYEASEPDVPDFNPRGCQKGACYSDLHVRALAPAASADVA